MRNILRNLALLQFPRRSIEAKKKIAVLTDEKKKKALAAQYEKQLVTKREAYTKDYATKLKATDASITEQIGKKATEMGYTMVVPKSAVIYGGDDITATILKVIK